MSSQRAINLLEGKPFVAPVVVAPVVPAPRPRPVAMAAPEKRPDVKPAPPRPSAASLEGVERVERGEREHRRASYQALALAAACMACGVSPEDLSGKRRSEDLVLARRVVVWLLRKETTMSFPRIRDHMGKAGSHTTMVDMYRHAADLAEMKVPAFLGAVERARSLIEDHPEQVREAIRRRHLALGTGK